MYFQRVSGGVEDVPDYYEYATRLMERAQESGDTQQLMFAQHYAKVAVELGQAKFVDRSVELQAEEDFQNLIFDPDYFGLTQGN